MERFIVTVGQTAWLSLANLRLAYAVAWRPTGPPQVTVEIGRYDNENDSDPIEFWAERNSEHSQRKLEKWGEKLLNRHEIRLAPGDRFFVNAGTHQFRFTVGEPESIVEVEGEPGSVGLKITHKEYMVDCEVRIFPRSDLYDVPASFNQVNPNPPRWNW